MKRTNTSRSLWPGLLRWLRPAPLVRVVPFDEAQAYRAYVRAVCVLSNGVEVIQNKTEVHAGILIAALFGGARNEIKIICRNLPDKTYGTKEVIDAATAFLAEHSGRLTILLEQPVSFEQNKLLRTLRDRNLLGHAELHLIHPDQLGAFQFHFLLADGVHFRFQADKNKFDAIAQFGSRKEDTIAKMNTAFEVLLSTSSPFTPSN